MNSPNNPLAIAMDTTYKVSFSQLFGATCYETFSGTLKSNNPYHYLSGFLLGIWFRPVASREQWASSVISTVGVNEQVFMQHAKEAAEIFSSDSFRKSINDAIEKTGIKFSDALIHVLSEDFRRFAQLDELTKWDDKLHAKAVAHFLGFALSMWTFNPAVAFMYSLKLS